METSERDDWDHTTAASSATSALAGVDVARLEVLWSPASSWEGAIAIVPPEGVELGREGKLAVDLGLSCDPRISRTHAAIRPSEHGFEVEDLGSRHGTRLSGVLVRASTIHSGSVLRIGDTLLHFERIRFRVGTPLIPERAPLWGPSVALHRLRGEIVQVARERLPILILGETGVGKELVARALHLESGREGAFVAVNCAALPRELAERELFGNEAGAFTGAQGAVAGLVEQAEGGTLFLDEVGELPPTLQAKLLRFLAEGEVRRVGGSRPRVVDVRVVAATLRNVEDEAAFRPDLRARLSGWELAVPPLRERFADVIPLARRFAGAPISRDAAEALLTYSWPRNVRELRHAMEGARVRSGGELIRAEHLPLPLRSTEVDGNRERAAVPIELRVRPHVTPGPEELRQVIDWFDGNLTAAASWFGKDRKQLYRWLERYGIEKDR